MSESKLRNHTDPSSIVGQRGEPDATTFKAIFESLLGLALDQLKQVPANAKAFQKELEQRSRTPGRKKDVPTDEKPFRDLGPTRSFSAKLKRASSYSGKSIDELRRNPREAGESYAAACFSPGLADPPRALIETEPSTLLLQAIERGLIGLPEMLFAKFKEFRLLKKNPSWSQCVQMFRKAYPDRFPDQSTQRAGYVIPSFLKTDQLRTRWDHKVQECVMLTLLTEELAKNDQNAISSFPSVSQIQTGASQSSHHVSLDAQDTETATGDGQKATAHKMDGADAPDLIVDKGKLQVRYQGKPLKINTGADFKAMQALHEAKGNFVSHGDLYRYMKGCSGGGVMPEALQFMKDAIGHIKKALKNAEAPYTVRNARGKGYRIVPIFEQH